FVADREKKRQRTPSVRECDWPPECEVQVSRPAWCRGGEWVHARPVDLLQKNKAEPAGQILSSSSWPYRLHPEAFDDVLGQGFAGLRTIALAAQQHDAGQRQFWHAFRLAQQAQFGRHHALQLS